MQVRDSKVPGEAKVHQAEVPETDTSSLHNKRSGDRGEVTGGPENQKDQEENPTRQVGTEEFPDSSQDIHQAAVPVKETDQEVALVTQVTQVHKVQVHKGISRTTNWLKSTKGSKTSSTSRAKAGGGKVKSKGNQAPEIPVKGISKCPFKRPKKVQIGMSQNQDIRSYFVKSGEVRDEIKDGNSQPETRESEKSLNK